jgi:lantibiotic modifying enzyme
MRTVERWVRSHNSLCLEDYSLCHGVMGNLDVLIAGSERGLVPKHDWFPLALGSLESVLVESQAREGAWSIVLELSRRPGLMRGTAGIIYLALRSLGLMDCSLLLPRPVEWVAVRPERPA